MMPHYSSEEARWSTIKDINTTILRQNNMWAFEGLVDDVQELSTVSLEDNRTDIGTKSYYVVTLTVRRNPIDVVLYVIVPLVLISIFNKIVYLIGTEGGICMFYYYSIHIIE